MYEARSIGREIRVTSHLFRRGLESIHSPAPADRTTGIQSMILHYLAQHEGREPVYQRDLERAFSIRRSTVTGVLQLMEKNGLLLRRSVASDGRLKQLLLTPAGSALHQSIEAGIHALEARAVQGMTAAEIDHFFMLLGKIQRNLEE